MPEPVRQVVQEWALKHRRRQIAVEWRDSVFVHEDARYTVLNLLNGASQTERAAGEYAGMTRLSPTSEIPVVNGCVVIEDRIFLGQYFLTVYQPKAVQGAWGSLSSQGFKRLRAPTLSES